MCYDYRAVLWRFSIYHVLLWLLHYFQKAKGNVPIVTLYTVLIASPNEVPVPCTVDCSNSDSVIAPGIAPHYSGFRFSQDRVRVSTIWLGRAGGCWGRGGWAEREHRRVPGGTKKIEIGAAVLETRGGPRG
jgi:hypothetical protein